MPPAVAGGAYAVRLLQHDARGEEHASEWVSVNADATLVIGSTKWKDNA